MSYGAALPAGNYHGSLGRYAGTPRPSHQGAAVRGLMKRRALQGVGMAGLGEGTDFCTDPGWTAVNALIAGAGSVITSTNTSSASSGEEGSQPDAGWSAVGAGTTGFANAWQTHCATQAQQQQQAASAAAQLELERQRAENEMAIAQARAQNEMAIATMRAQQGTGGIDQNTLLIAGGVGLAAILAVVLLRR
jgi:hypothetical protein